MRKQWSSTQCPLVDVSYTVKPPQWQPWGWREVAIVEKWQLWAGCNSTPCDH